MAEIEFVYLSTLILEWVEGSMMLKINVFGKKIEKVLFPQNLYGMILLLLCNLSYRISKKQELKKEHNI